MILTDRQTDALKEVVNIAFSRTAAALSDLTNQRVLLDVPKVSIHEMSKLQSVLNGFGKGEIATVHQVFTGPVSGDALLLLDYAGAVMLTDMLTETRTKSQKLDASDREVLTEVGNILLNACLGTFGNMLKVHISFSVPRLRLEELQSMLSSLLIGEDELRYVLVIYTNFRLRDSAVGGYLVLVLGVASLERLIEEIEKLG